MAITFINSSVGSAANPTAGFFTIPACASAGDWSICWWYSRAWNKSFTDDSGRLTNKRQAATSGYGKLLIYYVTGGVTAADITAGSYDWSASRVANETTVWGISVFRGVDVSADPFDTDSGVPAQQLDTQNPDPPSVTTTIDGCAILPIFGKKNDSGGSITVPAGYTTAGSGESALGNDASAGAAYYIQPAFGLEDPGTWTLGGAATDDGYVWTGALKPSAPAPTVTIKPLDIKQDKGPSPRSKLRFRSPMQKAFGWLR